MYKNLSDSNKQKIIHDLYVSQSMSFADIAKEYDTYPNKIRRDAIRFNIPVRNKSQAQKNALKTGKVEHPTKGTNRSTEEKNKISLGMYKSWKNMSDKDRQQRKEDSSERWSKLDDNKKSSMLQAAHAAIKKTSKEGSKLEKFILTELISQNYKVDFHKEQILSNTKLQIDIFLPKENVAIEIDGPSHFEPVWGKESLNKNQKYDRKKTGLIIGKGIKLVRIKQIEDYSNARAIILTQKLLDLLKDIKDSKDNLFYIEE